MARALVSWSVAMVAVPFTARLPVTRPSPVTCSLCPLSVVEPIRTLPVVLATTIRTATYAPALNSASEKLALVLVGRPVEPLAVAAVLDGEERALDAPGVVDDQL